jgi:zinc D-Ala-D-Ala carboxypeptidase
MTQLSEHFSLAELTVTNTGLDNTPDAEEEARLSTLAVFMEKVRTILGNHPITVNSAFRSEAVNEAAGGVFDSAHRLAYACDFTCPAFGSPLMIAERLDTAQKNGAIDFDQLIYEVTWVHISRDPQLREERLTHPTAGGYIVGIQDVS